MPRTHGRVMSSIWTDPDFLDLTAGPQRLYMFLLSQADLSHAGLVPMRLRRWASKVSGSSALSLEQDLASLENSRFIVTDEDTEEVLIRTFVRNDGVYKQPKVMLRLREDAKQIESPKLRAAFLAEIQRLPLDELSAIPSGRDGDGPSTREAVEGVVHTLIADFQPSDGYPSERVSDTPTDTPMRAGARVPPTPNPHTQPPAPMSSETTTALARLDHQRDDVEQLCNLLADRIADDGSKRPTITKAWRDSCRLMLDKDGRDPREVTAAIIWCQQHHFWRTNILSMQKLREKFDQLRKVAATESRPTSRQAKAQTETDDWIARAAERMGVEL